MESQPQNPEFRNNPENFTHVPSEVKVKKFYLPYNSTVCSDGLYINKKTYNNSSNSGF